MDKPYTIEVFCGNYDVPVKGADKESQWESEEVYRFLVVAVCPTVGEYEAGMPQAGFLFPALRTEVRIWKALIFLQKMGRVKNWQECWDCK